ncbi:MAG TPA: hypothetical protein VFG99_05155, partial [Chloroflexia bacterium]|nr:hypothetical protein [Chloroflexia bacterium]
MVGVISSLMLMLMVFAATIPGWLASRAAAGVAEPSNNSNAWRYQPALAPNPQASVPIENMLNKDGTLKLDTNFAGSLDPTGWLMEAGETGQPRFVRGTIPDGPKGGINTSRVPGDEKWDSSFGVPGIANWGEGAVNAIAVRGSDVYVGGKFVAAEGVIANNIAKWNGSEWSSLSGGVIGGGSTSVESIAISGNDLYVGGNFTAAGGISANSIARWDGSDWYPLGPGVGGVYGSIHDMVMTGDGDIYIGGGFNQTSGGLLVSNVAKWDGSEWHALGTEENNGVDGGLVQGLTLIGGDLYLGGSFTVAGGVSAKGFAKWNGNQWSQVGEGVSDPDGVTALASRLNDLYIGGKFTNIGGVGASQIARWDGSGWYPLTGTKGKGLNDKVYNQVNAIAVSGDSVYVGGAFSSAGTLLANNIARWSGGRWHSLGSGPSNGVNGFVGAIATGGSSGTEVYVAGDFTMAGGISANNIARWNGSQWSALGSGLRLTGGDAWITTLAVSGSNVYAGGDFDEAGGVAAHYIARWNGTQWSALGSGMEGGTVHAIAVLGSNVYAGGNFYRAGGTTANRIARWDGTQWHPLIDGTSNGMSSHVYALAVNGNDLYAGGVFTKAGDVDARFIAKWNGSSWSSLGSGTGGFDHIITAVTVMGDDLYVGGNFNTYNGTPTLRIAKWDGSSWSALGSGLSGFVEALAVKGDELFVGGYTFMAGDKPSNHFASWYEGVRPTPT